MMISPLPVDMQVDTDCNTARRVDMSIQEPGGEVSSRFHVMEKNGGMPCAAIYWNYDGLAEYQLKSHPRGNTASVSIKLWIIPR